MNSRFNQPAVSWRSAVLAAILALWPQVAVLQESIGYSVVSQIEPPLGPDSATIDEMAKESRARAKLIFADKISGNLSSGQSFDKPRQEEPVNLRPPFFGGSSGSVLLVVVLFVAALLLWLRFGGAGNLLRGRPVADRSAAPQAAPEAWAISPEDLANGPEALIRRLLALPDRGQAAAGLLRHSLLAAANETQIRLARADTERQAFDRLPTNWRQHKGLKTLLKIAELARYGGRKVSDETLAELADIARTILIPGGALRGQV